MKKWAVLSCLLTLVLLSGCAGILYPKDATEDYKVGYLTGYKAASGSLEAMGAGLTGDIFYTPSKLPDAVLKKIQKKPIEYQRGFTAGWKASIQSDSAMWDWIYND